MTATARLRRAAREPPLRVVAWQHPEWWLVPIIGAAWLGLGAAALVRATTGSPTSEFATMFVCPIVPRTPAGFEPTAAAAGTLAAPAMVVAMMGPLVLPALHHVGASGLWARRERGPSLVFAGVLAAWIPVIWGIDLAVAMVAGTVGAVTAVVATVALAVAWQLSAWRLRALRSCVRTVALPPRGRRADVACLSYGLLLGRSCVLSCVGLMAVVAAAGHGLVAMAAVAAVQLHERQARGPRPRRLPGLLVALAIGALAVAQTSA